MEIKEYISSSVLKALKILKENNTDAYLVGGAVRDILMKNSPKDYDIACSSFPSETLKTFSGFKTFETGISYGTITVIIDSVPIEITTYRKDGKYKNNRKPETVNFSKNITDDLSRRDFTINALAFSPYNGFIDLFGGLNDIDKKIIRAIGTPNERFKEDALRILRALRFSSQLGFTIEENTRNALFKNKNLLLNISVERIREEFNRILTGKNAAFVLSEYKEIIAVFIPEISHSFDFDQKSKHHIYDVYTHTLKALETTTPDLIIRLSVFLHDIAKPLCYTTDSSGFRHYKGHPEKGAELAKNILKRFKYDNKTTKAVVSLIKYHDTEIFPTKPKIKKFLFILGEELLNKLFLIKLADCNGKPNHGGKRYDEAIAAKTLMQQIISDRECYSLKSLKLSGNDLIKENIKRKNIGKILNMTLMQVIEEKITNEKSALLKYALEYSKKLD